MSPSSASLLSIPKLLAGRNSASIRIGSALVRHRRNSLGVFCAYELLSCVFLYCTPLGPEPNDHASPPNSGRLHVGVRDVALCPYPGLHDSIHSSPAENLQSLQFCVAYAVFYSRIAGLCSTCTSTLSPHNE